MSIATYGVLDLTAKTIGIIAIVAVITALITGMLFYIDALIAGAVTYVISSTAAVIGLVTYWTSVDWSGDGGLDGLGITFLSAVVLIVWLVMPATMLDERIKARRQHSDDSIN